MPRRWGAEICEKGKNMPESVAQYAEVFDVGQALQSVGGDVEFLTEVVGLTQAAWPTLLTDIRDGVSRGDLRAVETGARLAKAAARNVSAKRAYECALQLYTMACKGDLQAALNAIAALEREVEMLRFCLATLADDLCPS
jgi:hypothetical protein